MTRDLLDICRLAVEEMMKAGADLCDASASRGRALQVEIRENSVLGTQTHRARSVTLRAVLGRRIGIYNLHSLRKDAVKEAAALAVDTARNAEVDEDFRDLPHPEPYPEAEGTFNPAAGEIRPGRVHETAEANLQTALDEFGDAILSGGVSAFTSHGAIVNSNGVEAAESGSFVSVDFFSVLRRNGEIGSFFAFSEDRGPEALEDKEAALRASRKAAGLLGARPVPSGQYPLLLVPLASYDFLRTLIRSANAESIQRERSFLCSLRGKEIAPVSLSLADNPLVPNGIYTSKMDGEGAPRKRVEIISKGVLNDFLHSSYTANKDGVANNGHGGRSGGVYPTNIQASGATGTVEDLVSAADRAIMLLAGSLDCDPVNGRINTLIDYAMLVENGKVSHAVKSASVSGNFLEVLKGIQRLGRVETVIPGCDVPSILTSPVDIHSN